MADYESDSSGADDIETGVTLGYASTEPTGDEFSRLGGHPIWFNDVDPAPGDYSKCRVCNDLLSLIFQLNGDLPDQFAGHERRLYIFGCRRKTCRRKDGSIRGLRYTKVDPEQARIKAPKTTKQRIPNEGSSQTQPASALGTALFGGSLNGSTAPSNPFQGATSSQSNPFGPSTGAATNPFAADPLAAQSIPPPKQHDSLGETFADKVRLDDVGPPAAVVQGPVQPWPSKSSFPDPYPSYYIEADKEFLGPEPAMIPQQARLDDFEEPGSSSNTADDKSAFESTMDKTFQKFADRMTQNPEQVLRYEFGGQPLLYSKKDIVGRTWPKAPRCTRCSGQRQFELQLTPHAITELEAEDISLEGMEWGTIILAVCGNDCEGWSEEWIGVQWEELSGNKP